MRRAKSSRPALNASWLASLDETERRGFLAKLTDAEWAHLHYDWRFWARPEQLLPPGDWRTCLWLAGRGWGKTRTGAEAIRALKEAGYHRLGLVAPTAADARHVMVEGESGLLAIAPPWDRPRYEPSLHRLTWSNGARATLYSAEDPDALRGPQFDAAWCDELAAWRRMRETFDMLQFGLRLGEAPRLLISTTPRPVPLIRELVARADVKVIRGHTDENAVNLAPPFLEAVIGRYRGTRLGRQELDAEILDDNPDALWRRHDIERHRVSVPPQLVRIVVAVDPPATSGEQADACGIVVAGLGADRRFYVLADRSCRGLTPHQWASQAIAAYHTFGADRLIAEVNQGGDMVETIVRHIDPDIAFRAVRATRGKVLRAEPVSALYEQGRVSHLGIHAELEDQMVEFTPQRNGAGASPDRVDALVHGLCELMHGVGAEPRIRRL
ncbi:MAG: DNA-packaging protein [Methylobacteriaceae bacterium]|nr:DNA-packaging protein [Methylobacteriaceae bacterium]